MSAIHLKTAFSNIRRSPFQAFAAIFVLSVTFFVVTLMVLMVFASNNVLTYFETRPQIIAFVKDDVKTEEVAALQYKLETDERVKEVKYVTKEQALEIYKEATADNPLLSELVSPSIFPASLEFSLNDLEYAEDIIGEIKNEEIVDQVGFTASIGREDALQDSVDRLKTLTLYTRYGGGVFATILTITSLLVLLIIISMRITTRREEVEVLDLIGATRGFIRKPLVLEAITYAIVGVFMGWVVALILILYSTPVVLSYFNEIAVLPRDTISLFGLFGMVLGVELVVGIFLALIGSSVAMSRASRTK
jgi:cell division transport system permease protein